MAKDIANGSTAPGRTHPMATYLDQRSKAQREWYERSANKNKKKFIRYQTIIIVLGAIIPVIVVVEGVCSFIEDYGGVASAAIAATISIIAGLDKLKQPQPNWFNYRANEESIKKEEWFYKYRAGEYKGLSDPAADNLLVERVESIISADIARVTNMHKEEPKPKEDDTGGGGNSGDGAEATGAENKKNK